MGTPEASAVEGDGGPRPPARSAGTRSDWLVGLLLAGLGPFARLVQVLQTHQGEIRSPSALLLVAVLSGGALVLATVVVCRRSSRRPTSVGGGLAVAGLLFFSADLFGAHPLLRLVLSLLAMGLAAAVVSAILTRPALAVVTTGALVLYASLFGLSYVGWRVDHRLPPLGPVAERAAPMPNVYYFALGAFARDDVARHLSSRDDPTAFHGALAAEGFTVDRIATANYQQHGQSVASTLEQRLLIDDSTPPDRVLDDLSPSLQGANRTVEWFRSQGYRYVQTDQPQVEGGACDPNRADVCLPSRPDGVVDLPGTLRVVVDRTPAGPLLSGRRTAPPELLPTDVVDAVLDRGLVGAERPSFVVAQIIPPHPPYVRGAGCEAIEPVGSIAEGWADYHSSLYIDQLRCVRADLALAVKRLVAADPTAIIVAQSDTGPAFELKFGAPVVDLTAQMARNRFGAFRAWRLPVQCRTRDERASSLVNTFAVVQACLRDEPPKLLEARSYLVWFASTKVEPLPTGILYPG